jgi:peptidoglycan/LPS O-acetylase OafA/YrhL
MVCFFHVQDVPLNGVRVVPKDSLLRLFLHGHGAVIIFFVLSGYVLRSSLEGRGGLPWRGLVAQFLVGRFFRLFPVIVTTIGVVATIAWLIHHHPYSPYEILRNVALLDVNINGAFWSLQVEVFGSLLILAAFLLERRFGWKSVAALAVLMTAFSFFNRAYSTRGIFLAATTYMFLFGYLLACLPKLRRLGAGWGALLLAGSVTLFYWAHAHGDVWFKRLMLESAVAAAGIVMVLATDAYKNALQWAPLRLLGTVSYSFYAIHTVGVDFASSYVAHIAAWGIPHWALVATLFVLAAAAAFMLAIPLYYLVERPGGALGKPGRWRVYPFSKTIRPSTSVSSTSP